MRRGLLVPVLALGCAGLLGEARAAGREPMVIPGVGPDAAAYGSRAQPAAYAPRRASSGLGGGFLEMIVTGRDPTPEYDGLPPPSASRRMPPQPAPSYAPRLQSAAYGAEPAASLSVQRGLDPAFARQEIDYTGRHGAGTIVVDTPSRYLYLVLGNGRAIRYGIGVGRPGFSWRARSA